MPAWTRRWGSPLRRPVSAERLGLSPILACAANSNGGAIGKMIDAQSIVVTGVATGQQGNEGEILRYAFWHSIALASLVGVCRTPSVDA